MTVDELNIKITADAENFKKGINSAIKVLSKFRTYVRTSASEAKAAFGGLIETEMEMSGENEKNNGASSPIIPDVHYIYRGAKALPGTKRQTTRTTQTAYVRNYNNDTFSRAANVIPLETGETVIGAVTGSAADGGRPVEITTTVELDGDRIGESVSRYFMGRDRITNGIDG